MLRLCANAAVLKRRGWILTKECEVDLSQVGVQQEPEEFAYTDASIIQHSHHGSQALSERHFLILAHIYVYMNICV